MDLLHALDQIGSISINLLWFPLTLWTVVALSIIMFMKLSHNIHAFYHYHGRLALLFALPVGLATSFISSRLLTALTPEASLSAKFLVIQSPVVITAGEAEKSLAWTEPMFWLGCIIVLFTLISAILLIRLTVDYVALHRFSRTIDKTCISALSTVSGPNLALAESTGTQPSVAFSTDIQIPFTYGWYETIIVFPAEMQNNAENFNMALRHELMHVKHRDYLLNSLLMMIKAVFWFHPLVHYLYRKASEYREISCDSEVLADSSISKKEYAELLFKLASRKAYKNSRAVSMAVHPTNLKKRIQVMKYQTYSTKTFRNSLTLAFASVLIIAGVIACSDIQNPALTSEDVAEVQRNLSTASPDEQPLYIINGVRVDMANSGDIISRIKKEYIQSVTVLKNEQAIEQYGQAGKNGVVKLQLVDEEAALNDLLSAPPQTKQHQTESKDYFVVVEEMPKLKGGLASLQKNIRYPEEAREAGIQGRIVVQFIVNEQGQVEDPKIVRGIGGGADEEALRVVRLAKFEPGRQRGKPVRVQYSLPIIFRLSGSDSKAPKGASSANIKKPQTDILNTYWAQQLPKIYVIGY